MVGVKLGFLADFVSRMKLFAIFALVLAMAACSVPVRNFTPCGCMPPGAVPGSEQDLVANVGDRVFFALNESSLSIDSNETLHRQADWLKKYSTVNVLIAGNADKRGTEAYNLALGQRRAEAARNQLVALGVARSRIQTISYGKDCPVAAGNDDAAYQQNRNAITSVQGFNPQNCH